MNCCWREFQGFCGNNLLWAYNHVNASCMITSSEQGNFCFTSIYLINFRKQEFLDFCGTNHVIYDPKITWMLIAYWPLQNRDILNRLFFNVDCLCLCHELLLIWNSKFLLKQPYMSLQWDWCLFRNDIIKIGKFVFV